ncbi:hypothetical protein DWF00_05665 [Bosea caraganae]|uniref:Uncharacterized protein n=1 Tax=Bosea caraganae TaxID=2763117 RepID=A0A370L4G6_9HYPH|nr:hypothetical protein [Bosea caraganae]RDJ22855.1 hypothetical protein DWE98_16910 [Bosea caraganae]RDJ28634.1 hypothetical protein DWF00_05665 [Bosea caraganae]
MIEPVPLYSTTIPLAFFVWGPVLVMLLFWLTGLWASRQGVARMLESDWNGFNAADVDKLFAAYGDERRAKYRSKVLPADMAFALVYAIVGALIIAGVSMRGYTLWIALLCGGGWLLGGLCDLVENFAIARLLDKYPKVEAGDVATASRFTQFKLVLFALGIVGALAAVYLVFRPLAA